MKARLALLPLPDKHFFVEEMQSRKISYDSYISISGNRHSVPIRYAGKKVFSG